MEMKTQLRNILAPNVIRKDFLYHIDQKKTRKRTRQKHGAAQIRAAYPACRRYWEYLPLPMPVPDQNPAGSHLWKTKKVSFLHEGMLAACLWQKCSLKTCHGYLPSLAVSSASLLCMPWAAVFLMGLRPCVRAPPRHMASAISVAPACLSLCI